MTAHNNTSGATEAPLAASLRRFRTRYAYFLEWVVGGLMVILAVEVTVGVVFRTIGQSLSWYDELASVLLSRLSAAEAVGDDGRPTLVEPPPHKPPLPPLVELLRRHVARGVEAPAAPGQRTGR